MDKASEFYSNWLKTQETFVGNWTEMIRQYGQSIMGIAGPKVEMAGGPDFSRLYHTWLNAMTSAFPKSEALETLRETTSKLFDSSNVYVKLYEVWGPLFQAIQGRVMDVNTYKELIDPAKYKEILDRIFRFSPDGINEFLNQSMKFTETMGSTREFMQIWTEASQKSMKAFPQFLEGHPESIMSVFHNMFTAFDKTFGRIFHIPPVGKDREKADLFLKSSDDMTVYMTKSIQYQYMMYTAGQQAMDKLIETITAKLKEGAEFKSVDEISDLWLQVSEKQYLELFHTDEFSKLQGDLLDAALNVRSHLFKLQELYLYDTAIPVRSEMDDLYKTVYELKKKLSDLEKRVEKLSH
jgi:class III poly(R)-hydroxyalkanoic acid synthase PhaE subunit